MIICSQKNFLSFLTLFSLSNAFVLLAAPTLKEVETKLTPLLKKGESLVHVAVKQGDIEALQILLTDEKYSKEINNIALISGTPLHSAVQLSKDKEKAAFAWPIVELLIKYGANPLIRHNSLKPSSSLNLKSEDLKEFNKKFKQVEVDYIAARKIEPKGYDWAKVTLASWTHDIFLYQPEFHGRTSASDIKVLVDEASIQALVSYESWQKLLEAFKGVMKKEESLCGVQKYELPSQSQVAVFGDIHGSVHSLLRNLLKLKGLGFINNSFKCLPNKYVLFLGDYSDRGRYSIEVWVTIMLLKLANPGQVFLIRGNHENEDEAARGTFVAEYSAKFSKDKSSFEKDFSDLFPLLSSALFMGCDGHYNAVCHGGLPYSNRTEEQLTKFNEFKKNLHKCLLERDKDCCSKLCDILEFIDLRFVFSGAGDQTHVPVTNFSRDYMNNLSDPQRSFIVESLFCGHKHYFPPIAFITDDGATELIKPEKVVDHTVFVFTSAPEPLGNFYPDSRPGVKMPAPDVPSKGGFGIWKLAPDAAQWEITPYADITEIQLNKKAFVYVKKTENDIAFSYRLQPQADEKFQDALK